MFPKHQNLIYISNNQYFKIFEDIVDAIARFPSVRLIY